MFLPVIKWNFFLKLNKFFDLLVEFLVISLSSLNVWNLIFNIRLGKFTETIQMIPYSFIRIVKHEYTFDYWHNLKEFWKETATNLAAYVIRIDFSISINQKAKNLHHIISK